MSSEPMLDLQRLHAATIAIQQAQTLLRDAARDLYDMELAKYTRGHAASLRLLEWTVRKAYLDQRRAIGRKAGGVV